MSINPWHGPWSTDPETQNILECDALFVRAFNAEVDHTPSRHTTRVRTDLLPEPWFGPVDAPVVFLLLNPGVSTTDRDTSYHTASYAQRPHASRIDDHAAHFHLASVGTPGRAWWDAVVSPMAPDGIDGVPHHLAKAVGAIQYFPYHSENFDHAHIRLPSQTATFALARGAMLIVRGWRYWVTAMPGLADGLSSGQVIRLRGRSVRINEYAVGEIGGPAAVARVRQAILTVTAKG
jgi:hypothetical protein